MTRPFFPPQSRMLVGSMILVIAVSLSFGQRYSVNGVLENMSRVEQNRSPGDSAAYASALYHASFAQLSHDERWGPTGYATLGLAGSLLGIGLIVSGLRRRDDRSTADMIA